MHILFHVQVCGASDSTILPPNFVKLAKDVYTPDLIAASDCMLGQSFNPSTSLICCSLYESLHKSEVL